MIFSGLFEHEIEIIAISFSENEGGSKAVWIFCKNSPDLVQPPFLKKKLADSEHGKIQLGSSVLHSLIKMTRNSQHR